MKRGLLAKKTIDKVLRVDKLLKLDMQLKSACKVVGITRHCYYRGKLRLDREKEAGEAVVPHPPETICPPQTPQA